MKILFLDVDGVLNHSGCPEWKDGHRVLDADCVARVKLVCERTGARIVVSSTWRLGDGMRPLRQAFGRLIIGETPYRYDSERRVEIGEWISAHPDTGRVCIVDDDFDAEVVDLPFVRTDFESGGFTDVHMERVVTALEVGSRVATGKGE